MCPFDQGAEGMTHTHFDIEVFFQPTIGDYVGLAVQEFKTTEF